MEFQTGTRPDIDPFHRGASGARSDPKHCDSGARIALGRGPCPAHAGGVVVVPGPAYPADAGRRQALDLERAGRGAWAEGVPWLQTGASSALIYPLPPNPRNPGDSRAVSQIEKRR